MLLRRLLLSLLLVTSSFQAQLKLAPIFKDHMILQRKEENRIWGWSEKNETIHFESSWLSQILNTTSNTNGYWEFLIDTPKADLKEHSFTITSTTSAKRVSHIMFGELWICAGQSNMEYSIGALAKRGHTIPVNSVEGNNIQIRQFHLERSFHYKPKTEGKGQWTTANPTTLSNFSAVGFSFANHLHQKLSIPIGIINIAYSGTPIEGWMSRKILASKFNQIDLPSFDPEEITFQSPTVLYNTMVYPFLNLKVKGILWYQGEANVYQNPNLYEQMFTEMIASWRSDWNAPDLPFHFVQLAPFEYGKNWHASIIREAQLNTFLNTKNTGIITTGDTGEEMDIHPVNKSVIGKRLANCALQNQYGFENIDCAPILPNKFSIEKNKALIEFNTKLSLTSKKKYDSNFTIAGKNKIFYPAKVILNKEENTLELFHPKVKKPVAVRYAWSNWYSSSLFDKQGVPIPPFKTDQW